MSEADILKALSSTAGSGGDFIPPKLAEELIDLIRWNSFGRQLWENITMPVPTFTIPKLLGASSIYYVAEGGTAPAAGLTTGTITLVAKKLMAMITVDAELNEDSLISIMPLVKKDFATQIALSEEDAFLNGDDTDTSANLWAGHQPTGNERNDAKFAFKGLRKLASGTAVDLNGANISLEALDTAIINAGVYGKDVNDLDVLVTPRDAKKIRQLVRDYEKYTTYDTHIPGLIGKLPNGLTFYVSGFLPSNLSLASNNDVSCALLVNRNSPLIGDRRQIQIRTFDQIWTDQTLVVPSERIAFTARYTDAIVPITNIRPV